MSGGAQPEPKQRFAGGESQFRPKAQVQAAPKSGHLLLAAVSSSATSERIVRWTGELAEALNCRWIALYVESPYPPEQAEHAQIARTLVLARELGAEVITATDTDLVRSVLRVASQRNVTQIIIGKPPTPFWKFFRRDGILRRLTRECGGVDVHIISNRNEARPHAFRIGTVINESTLAQYLLAAGVVGVITVAALLLGSRIGPPHAAALIFLLGVVLLGSRVGRGPTLFAALMSALLWDYFILPPIFEFRISHFEDGLVFGMYFIVALIMGQLTTRIRAQQEIERLGEERATALYLLTRELTEATYPDQIIQRAVQQMERVFNAHLAVFMADQPNELLQSTHRASTFKPSAEGRQAAEWAFAHDQNAGKFTGNLPHADALYAPLATSEGMAGVIGLQFDQPFPPTVHQLNLLEAFLQQIGLALERHRLHAISESAKVLAESERLSKTLLDSMSHEMRTPIAIIKSATGNLAELRETVTSPPQQAMIGEIQLATERLNRLVGNVLDITRLESGHFKPKVNECDVSDLVHVAVTETEKELSRHHVTVEIAPNLPLVQMDFVLMQQALTNLLSNAAAHTPQGTAVRISARVEDEFLVFAVEDNGPGIPPRAITSVFDKFYRGSNAPTGGTGLGLSLVKGFVEAQGGQVKAENLASGGAAFTIRLPLQHVPAESLEPVYERNQH